MSDERGLEYQPLTVEDHSDGFGWHCHVGAGGPQRQRDSNVGLYRYAQSDTRAAKCLVPPFSGGVLLGTLCKAKDSTLGCPLPAPGMQMQVFASP